MPDESASLPRKAAGAARFLRGGGVVSWSEWASLGVTDRDALEAAGEIVAIERAERIAQAILLAITTPPVPPQDAVDAAMERAGRAALKVTG